MPFEALPDYNPFAWVPKWRTKAKNSTTIDGVEIMLMQVIDSTNSSDLIHRGGVDFLAKTSTAISADDEWVWLIGNDIYAILINFQSSIGWSHGQLLNFNHGRKVADYLSIVARIGQEFTGEGKVREEGGLQAGNHIEEFEFGITSRLKERYAAAGKTLWWKTCYGGFHTFRHQLHAGFRLPDGTNVAPNHTYWKSLLQSKAAARNSCDFFRYNCDDAGFVHDIKFYAENFQTRNLFYVIVYVARVCVYGTTRDDGTRRAEVAFHYWAKVEQLPGQAWTIHNGYRYVRELPNGGKVISTEHPQTDFGLLLAMILFVWLAKVKSACHWENSEIYGDDPNYMTLPNPNPNQDRANLVVYIGPGDPPYNSAHKGFPESPMGYMDLLPLAKEYYKTTYRTAGISPRDWDYKRVAVLGNSGWQNVTESWVVAASDGTQILEWANMYDGFWAEGANKTRGGLAVTGRTVVDGSQEHVSAILYHAGLSATKKEKYKLRNPLTGREYGPFEVQGGSYPKVFNETFSI